MVLLLGVVLLTPHVLAAQGIGDVAAREREKRRASGTAPNRPRVFTNTDLREEDPAKKKTDEQEASAPATARPTEVVRDENDRPIRATGESASEIMDARRRQRQAAQATRDEAQARVESAESRVRELQDQLNPMSPSFVYAQPNAANAPAEEARVRQELATATTELDGAREALAAATRHLEDVEQGRSPSER